MVFVDALGGRSSLEVTPTNVGLTSTSTVGCGAASARAPVSVEQARVATTAARRIFFMNSMGTPIGVQRLIGGRSLLFLLA
jgi:hypothetical protein